MSSEQRVLGLKPADKKWKAMQKAWKACETAGVPVPEEVRSFFNGDIPDPKGVEVNINEAVTEWDEDEHGRRGTDIDISKIPPDVTIIRILVTY